jgi:hypothetical protein
MQQQQAFAPYIASSVSPGMANSNSSVLIGFVKEGMRLISAHYSISNKPSATDTLTANAFRDWKAAYGHRPIVLYDAWVLIKDKARELKLSRVHFCGHCTS